MYVFAQNTSLIFFIFNCLTYYWVWVLLLGTRMAFLNRVGNALKQNLGKHVASQFPASNASPFQAIRSMSTASKLFVGGAVILNL